MRFASKITAAGGQITIDTGSIHQEGEATISVPPLSDGDMEGVGVVLADGAGVGGGHGGYGGGADTDNYQSGLLYFVYKLRYIMLLEIILIIGIDKQTFCT